MANNRINGVLAISRSFGDVQHKVIAMPRFVSKQASSGGSGGKHRLVGWSVILSCEQR